MEEGLEGKRTFNPSASLLGRVTINVEGSQKPPSYHGSHHLGSSAESGEMISLGSSHDKFDDLSAYTAGLSSHEATQRLYRWGPNDATLTSGRNNRRLMLPSRLRGLSLLVGLHRWVTAHLHESMLAKYCEQFKNPLIGLLLVSATISFFLGQIENGLSIFIAVLLVVTVAFIQEYRTEKSLEALHRLAPPKCKVVRDGKWQEMLAAELVPGDVVEIHTGDRVPADIRLFQAIDVETDESMLTGETDARPKTTKPRHDPAPGAPSDGDASVDDLILMATLVRQGYGRGVVAATGSRTRFGRMYTLMKDTETKRSPLQQHLDRLGEQLSLYSLGVIVVLALIGIIQRQPLLQIFTVAVSLAVAAIPEGLPIVATITLALGVLRLSRKNVIVRRLPAVEALGSVDVLCIDKTGTLTMNQLTVQEVCPMDGCEEQLHLALTLCNNSHQGGGEGGDWHGTPVDVAIRQYLTTAPTQTGEHQWQRVEEVPFTSERKFMAVKCQQALKALEYCFLKGAPEVILAMTTSSHDTVPTSTVQGMMARGLRVIAVAGGESGEALRLLGLVGMCDPPRPDMAATLQQIQRCGVKCIMVTGDAEQTALTLARQIKWNTVDAPINAQHLRGILQDDPLALERVSIVYRASPEDKLLLVDALQQAGHVVAMTGDGVNDAPALKMADIGVAMGHSGTDVARAAAQIILADDRLASLLDGMEEGKAIFSNIRHFIRFQLGTSLAALSLIATCMLCGLPTTPMNAMQILLINIIMDGPPAQSLGVEAVDPTSLHRPPRPKSSPILTRALLLRTTISATHIMLGTTMVMFWERAHHPLDTTRTFVTFVLFSMAYAHTCRSSYRSIWSLGLFRNRMLTITTLISLLLLAAVVYAPALNRVFQTAPLAATDVLALLAVASTLIAGDELIKALCLRPILLPHPSRDLYLLQK